MLHPLAMPEIGDIFPLFRKRPELPSFLHSRSLEARNSRVPQSKSQG